MPSIRTVVMTLMLAGVLVPAEALAQGGDASQPVLHVNDRYKSCFFDLHPELTKAEFKEFAAELGSILRFRQLGDTTTLGKGRVDISLQFTSSSIDDAKGAWNNTMSHPAADHYLGDAIAFPRLVARFGISDSVDIGAWGGLDPHSNYGLVGIETKVVLVRQEQGHPISLSIRPSVASLVGPSEVWAGNASIDVSASRAFGAFAPYVGVATSASLAVDRSNDVDLDPAVGTVSVAYAGVTYGWRGFLLSAEIEKGTLVSYGVRLGRRF